MKQNYNQYSKLWQLPERREPINEYENWEEEPCCEGCEEGEGDCEDNNTEWSGEEYWDEEDYSLEYLDDRQESRFPLFKPEPWQTPRYMPLAIPALVPFGTGQTIFLPTSPMWPFGGQYIQDKKTKPKTPAKKNNCPEKYPAHTKTKGGFNCAGFAFRNYKNISKAVVEKKYLPKFTTLANCKGKCKPCDIKCWVWTWDNQYVSFNPMRVVVEVEEKFLTKDKNGKPKVRSIIHQLPPKGYHIVCGQTDKKGKGPATVYSKPDKKQDVKGPMPPSSFAPPGSNKMKYSTLTRRGERLLIDNYTNKTLKVIRSNIILNCYCVSVKKLKAIAKWK